MKAIGVGRFVRDPELRAVNDTHVCEFSLAINEYRKVNGERKEYTNFFDFVIWDKAAEVIVKYCNKGDMIFVSSTARQDKWKDKESGTNRYKIVFRVDDFTFIGGRRNNGDNQSPPPEVESDDDGAAETPF